MARVQNSRVYSPDNALMPFRSILTNTAIPNFPATLATLGQLGRDSINAILVELGLPIEGNLNSKKQILRMHIGVQNIQG
jgi:hypothetical protein